jgi:hypothetical protein
MKIHLLVGPVLLGCVLVPFAPADPILPYQQPIEQQLTTDLNGGAGNAATLNRALNAYHRASRSLSGDISILRSLNDLLASESGYASLLADAANAYLADFQPRRDAIVEQLRPAPRSTSKTLARKQIRRLDGALSNAVDAASTAQEISALQSAAAKLINTSNTVQRALRAPIGLSSMVARIGALSFQSTRGFIVGGTNFTSAPGAGSGAFDAGNGILAVTAFANGNIARAIHLHVEGITSDTPATYPLGAGDNIAFYDATDRPRRREYHFEANSALANSTVPNAFVTIDFISTNYILGRFAFIGTNSLPLTNKDTNTVVTISDGEFQLNFSH